MGKQSFCVTEILVSHGGRRLVIIKFAYITVFSNQHADGIDQAKLNQNEDTSLFKTFVENGSMSCGTDRHEIDGGVWQSLVQLLFFFQMHFLICSLSSGSSCFPT